ncbi:hypothetical protein FP026_04990 [Rhizobium tropici]|uniref:Uncharacterized protein n=1 Tax=Rhizobium tropici TaxID=398 RepID=A0A5B0WDZ9_RHITR|nr:hypothetical protein [Rhizobium tropici]KAA1184728.1 hypothetical protein FP026_04990 [Rhizobium tropici]
MKFLIVALLLAQHDLLLGRSTTNRTPSSGGTFLERNGGHDPGGTRENARAGNLRVRDQFRIASPNREGLILPDVIHQSQHSDRGHDDQRCQSYGTLYVWTCFNGKRISIANPGPC